VGSGLAVLHGWWFSATDHWYEDQPRRRSSIGCPGLYVSAGDMGFWQGAFGIRPSHTSPRRDAITGRQPITVELLYGDYEGARGSISRFAVIPVGEDRWLATGLPPLEHRPPRPPLGADARADRCRG